MSELEGLQPLVYEEAYLDCDGLLPNHLLSSPIDSDVCQAAWAPTSKIVIPPAYVTPQEKQILVVVKAPNPKPSSNVYIPHPRTPNPSPELWTHTQKCLRNADTVDLRIFVVRHLLADRRCSHNQYLKQIQGFHQGYVTAMSEPITIRVTKARMPKDGLA